MSHLGHKFLVAALGVEGAKALRKAVEREPGLADVLIPRAILGWLDFTTQHEYEGSIPGIENSYVQFKKHEEGFSGTISLDEGVYSFEKSSVFHLAASIATAIGLNPVSVSPEIRDTVLVNLGKSIDTLAKAQVLMEEIKKSKSLKPTKMTIHGEYHIEHNGSSHNPYSVVHSATGNHVQAGIPSLSDAQPIAEHFNRKSGGVSNSKMGKVELPGQAHKPTPQQGPLAPQPPIKQPAIGAKAKQPKLPSLSVGKSEAQAPCELCGGKQIVDDKFKGCICFRDLAKNVVLTQYSDGYVLSFKGSIKLPDINALRKAFRGM